jgi:hypothetical protein
MRIPITIIPGYQFTTSPTGGERVSNAKLNLIATPQGYVDDALTLKDASFVIVNASSDPVDNGVALKAAYLEAAAVATALNAGGSSHRVACILFPGLYDVGTSGLDCNSPYVDLVGLSLNPDHQFIYGTGTGLVPGVIQQSVDGLCLYNISAEIQGPLYNGDDNPLKEYPAAYYPVDEAGYPNTIINNCKFRASPNGELWATRCGIVYSGTYKNIDCSGQKYVFGGGAGGSGSGSFTDVIAGTYSFGNSGEDNTGSFRRCYAGIYSFGRFKGRMIDCDLLLASSVLSVGEGAYILNSSIYEVAFSGSPSVTVAHCRMNTVGGTYTNTITTPYNVIDSNL